MPYINCALPTNHARLFLFGIFIFSTCILKAQGLDDVSRSFYKDKDSGLIKVYASGGKIAGKTYLRLLKRELGVELIETNQFVLSTEQAFYNELSIPFIKNNYGDSIFLKTRFRAYVLDTSGLGVRPPSYRIPQDSIKNFFYRHISPEIYDSLIRTFSGYYRFYCLLEVDSLGQATNISPLGLKNHSIDSALKNSLVNFKYIAKPATDDGIPSSGVISFFLEFNHNTIALFEKYNAVKE